MSLPSIFDLLATLSNDNHEYVYRGQTREYPSLIPSAFRSVAEPVADDAGAYSIHRSRVIAGRTRRQDEQAKLRAFWVNHFGLSLGNLLAQQYLVQSEVIDITTDPKVAAFFATRRGPGCRHLHSASEPGVIVRWKRPSVSRSLAELQDDLTLGMLHPWRAASGAPPLPVKYAVASPGSAEYAQVRDEPNAVLLLRPEIFTLQEIQAVVAAAVENERGHIYPHHWIFEYFPTSRWFAQAGGVLRPTLRFPARATINGEGIARQRNKTTGSELAGNVKVVVGMPDRVGNAASAAFGAERFYFQHSPGSIDLDPELLWPSPRQDLMFMMASILAWTTSTEYFDEIRANCPWEPDVGLLDRGNYPDVINEQYLRSEWDLFNSLRLDPPAEARSPPGVYCNGSRPE